jgi:hypothetical protein
LKSYINKNFAGCTHKTHICLAPACLKSFVVAVVADFQPGGMSSGTQKENPKGESPRCIRLQLKLELAALTYSLAVVLGARKCPAGTHKNLAVSCEEAWPLAANSNWNESSLLSEQRGWAVQPPSLLTTKPAKP